MIDTTAAGGNRLTPSRSLTDIWTARVADAWRLHRPDDRARLAAFVASRRHPHGGFQGLDGALDPYASSFGFELLAAAGLPPDPRDAEWLSAAHEAASLDLPHLVSLLRCRRSAGLPTLGHEWMAALAQFHVGAGRWRLRSGGDDGGPYAAFLAVVGSELAGADMPPGIVDALGSHVRPEGGISAEPNGPPTVPVTAAAVAAMIRMGAAPPRETLSWLAAQRLPEGGWRVSPSQRHGDLLATAVAAFALGLAGRTAPGDVEQDLDFVAAHAEEDGGYSQAPGAPSDLESTWYALLAIGSLLQAPPGTVSGRRRR